MFSQVSSSHSASSDTDNATSEIYALFAYLFKQAPNQELLTWLTELEIEAASQNAMIQAWHDLKICAQQISPTQIEEEFHALFIGLGSGEVVPFASWHIAGTLMEKPLVAIRQDLQQFGYERQTEIKEPEDSIVALCEVMSMLQIEAFDKQQAFFNRHLKPWVSAFCDAITTAPSARFYRYVAQALQQFCLIEQVRYTPKE